MSAGFLAGMGRRSRGSRIQPRISCRYWKLLNGWFRPFGWSEKTVAADLNAKEISRETNHWIGCGLRLAGGSFDAGAGSARTAATRTRGETARIFCGQLERRGEIYRARYGRTGVVHSKVGMGVWRIFYCGSFGQQIARG